MASLDLGHLIEGRVEQDPQSGRFFIMGQDQEGRPLPQDLQVLLARYLSKDVRVTLASFDDLSRITEMVEAGNQELGDMPDVPFGG